jgi:low temperature requirement protein LtrA
MSKGSSGKWWGPPQNFEDRKYERKISWLELFYDLVYVAAISQLTHHIAAEPSWHTAGLSFLLFSLIFWSWVNGSQYYDLHGSDSIRTRLLTFWQMLAVAAVAVTIPGIYEGHHLNFSITFASLQVLITYLWWSVGFYDPSHRVFNKFYTINYVIAFGLLIVSAFTSYPIAIFIWIAVLILNLTPPLTGAGTINREFKKRGQVFTASATIVERLGLFTIIVLAESILGTVTGISGMHEHPVIVWLALILAILIAFLLWSLYFDMTSEQETKKGYRYMQWLIFLHFPLLASYAIAGGCIKVLLADAGTEVPIVVQWMFCIATAIILLMIFGLTKIMKEEEEDRSYIKPVSRQLVILPLCLLIVPFFGNYLNTISFLGIVAFLLLVPVVTGIRSWVMFKFYDRG